jgi:phenylacetate-CoA ligase
MLNRIYRRLPLVLQNWAISIFGLHWFSHRFGGIFRNEFLECKSREYYSSSQWEEYQVTELRKLLIHAFETVKYYRELFTRMGFTRETLNQIIISDLSKFPVLEKDTLRSLGQSELLSEKPEKGGEFYPSSGSTGTPTKILFSRRMHQKYFAIYEAVINNWAGLTFKDPRGTIGGRRIVKEGVSKGPYYRYNFVEKQTYFSAYHIALSTVKDYINGMIKHKVKYMTGYASANYFLARFIEEAGLKAPQMKAVLTSSEKLTPEMRDTFRRVYGCETFDSYNGVEASCLISECECHKLHIVPDVGIVEILNEKGRNCKPGETGEVITTGLLNFNQPLIRYRMGDYVTLSSDQNCKCGRKMLVVDEIVGRIEDTVIGPDGREMMRFHGVFIDIPSIIEGQVIQHTLTDFEVNVVAPNNLTANEMAVIQGRMVSQLGNIKTKINIVKSIPRNANGKFKAVISYVKRNKVQNDLLK